MRSNSGNIVEWWKAIIWFRTKKKVAYQIKSGRPTSKKRLEGLDEEIQSAILEDDINQASDTDRLKKSAVHEEAEE